MTSPSQRLHTLGIPPNAWGVNEDMVDMSRPAVQPKLVSVASQTKTLRLDLHKTACIVVDMQNDFCHPEGWLGSVAGVDVTPARAPIAPLQTLLPELRTHKVPIVWCNWGNRPDLLNISPGLRHVYNPTGTSVGLADPWPPHVHESHVLTKDSWSADIVDELTPPPTKKQSSYHYDSNYDADIFVDKYRMSGFWDTPLDSILKTLGRTTLLFAGVNADQCVLCTLQDANFLGYDCILLQDCTATTSPDYCMQATIYNVNQIFGFTVDSKNLIQAMNS